MSIDLTRRRSVVARDIAARTGHPYYAFHSPRYATLLRLIDRHVGPPPHRILDVGATEFTDLVHQQFGGPVDSLGFEPEEDLPRGRHFHFDLNDAQWPERWRRDLPLYDVVVLAEVIEHLHTSPALVLGFLRTLVRPGGVLVVQTPNAVRLGVRVKLLLGRNPYQLIKEDVTEPGHFREYTRRELTRYAVDAGFDVVDLVLCSYFDIRFAHHDSAERRPALVRRAVNLAYRSLPPSLRTGMTAVLRRPAPDGGS